MAACRIVYQPVTQAIEAIGTSAKNYRTAGDSFVSAFNSAIAGMEGAAKDALETFFKNNIQPFVTDSLPSTVEGMQTLLQSNLDNFVEVDQQLANSISGG